MILHLFSPLTAPVVCLGIDNPCRSLTRFSQLLTRVPLKAYKYFG
ncbi:hypothetical protein MYAER_0339 [Microcystis aeruginosa NIES-2549]|uniref:Uncharacterized protein n=1 Tax=Microcystis aeruginosa NIES-2549 TaxID=1641812 RepID=A0A0F6U193_MICAE|nr:hypothetical protein MYAER_0339 [Microcystis aeruginosa NIES-2549]